VPGSASDWLARAKGDLAIAKAPLPEGAFWEDLCFHAQQAAEKAMKAVFVQHGLTFRYTHDLDELITGLKTFGRSIPAAVEESIVLTSYAWEARYRGSVSRSPEMNTWKPCVWPKSSLNGQRGH
jgi:HEPN domain-containing protein